MSTAPHRQSGFAAIAAVFLIVVLAGMGAFMLTFSNTAQLTSAQDVQGSRAYWAARGGMAWGLTQVNAGAVPACAASSAPNLALDGFAVTLTVRRECFTEAGSANVSIYQVQAVASSGAAGSISFVERSVSATFEK